MLRWYNLSKVSRETRSPSDPMNQLTRRNRQGFNTWEPELNGFSEPSGMVTVLLGDPVKCDPFGVGQMRFEAVKLHPNMNSMDPHAGTLVGKPPKLHEFP